MTEFEPDGGSMEADPIEVTVTESDIDWATSAAQRLCSPPDQPSAIRLLSSAFARKREAECASKLPRALREIACTLLLSGDEVHIFCDNREEAEEVLDWLDSQVGGGRDNG